MNPELSTPAWYLYDFRFSTQHALLLRLEESDYRAASFLDERVVRPTSQRRELPLQELQAGLPRAASPVRSIFHLGHCGSTLLSRALAASLNILPLREPLTMRRLAAETGTQQLLALVLAAHTRVFHPPQVAMIKASSTCNRLIEPVLEQHPDARAILLYVPLETYLAGMLGKLTPAADLRTQAEAKLADWQAIPKAAPLAVEGLDTAQLAVLAWLSSMYFLLAAAGRFPRHTLLLNFEVLLADAETSLTHCANFMGMGTETAQILSAWPEISNGYSKQPDLAYSAFNRRTTLQRGRTSRSNELDRGMTWAGALVRDIQTPPGSQGLELFFS